jgi:hypothetical protein
MRRMKDGGVFVIGLVAMLFANLVLMSVHSANERTPSTPPFSRRHPAPAEGGILTPEIPVPLLPRCWSQGLR